MKLLGRTHPLDKYPILECLGVIKRLGFDGVEICLENNDIAPDRLDQDLVTAVREQVQSLDLATHSVSYHKDYIYDDREFDLTCRAVAATPSFGTGIFVFSGTRERTGDEAEWQRMVQRTARLVELAEQHEVTLAQEFEPGFVVGSTADLLRLFDELPSERLAANADLGHLFLCDPDPLASVVAIGDKIVHGHVENMAQGIHDHLLPSEGDMELSLYIEALRQIGFEGGLALDLYSQDYESVAPQEIAYLRSLISVSD